MSDMAESFLSDVKTAKVVNGDVRIAYKTTGERQKKNAILLVHGYPQTMFTMRFLAPLLAAEGMFVVSADYRGAGGSSMPHDGYDKRTMAGDLHELMTEALGIESYVVLGHDIGSMVATAQALEYRESVRALILMECPQPGTSVYKHFTTEPSIAFGQIFHFFFHACADLPEQLTHGKEALYVQHFYDRFAFQPNFLTNAERQVYYHQFAQPGRMRAGFEVYRAFRKDDKDVKENVEKHGKMDLPVLATGGDQGEFIDYVEKMAKEVANKVDFAPITNAAHWVPEENPKDLTSAIMTFLRKHVVIDSVV